MSFQEPRKLGLDLGYAYLPQEYDEYVARLQEIDYSGIEMRDELCAESCATVACPTVSRSDEFRKQPIADPDGRYGLLWTGLDRMFTRGPSSSMIVQNCPSPPSWLFAL